MRPLSLADNCFCAALLLGLTAYDAECLKTVFGDLSGKEYKQHRQIRRILRAGVKAAMVRDTEDDMQDGLLRMLASLQDGRQFGMMSASLCLKWLE